MQIQAIILDIGGVLWRADGPPLSEKWATRCGLDAETFDRIVFASEWGKQALRGTITSEEEWATIGAVLNLSSVAIHELERDSWIGRWDTVLLDYLRTLKASYKLGIISDAPTGTRAKVSEWVNEDLFDVIVFSAEEGICKPDPRIFRSALGRLGVEASASIFIDDRLRNVEGAKQLGMHAIHYEGFSHLVSALSDYIS